MEARLIKRDEIAGVYRREDLAFESKSAIVQPSSTQIQTTTASPGDLFYAKPLLVGLIEGSFVDDV